MNRPNRLKPALLACAASLGLLAGQPAFAQSVDSAKLLELMVAKGLVTREEADGLLAQATVAPAPPPVPAGGVVNGVQTIPYIPQIVRDQIKDELRAELGTQAQTQGWAAPGQTPEWTRGITLSGDIRVRGEGVFMDESNADIFVDYGAINAGAGQNINENTPGYVGPPYLNTLEDRQRARIRARFGLTAQIDSWISAEVRVATGNDSSPVSTNQTLGGGDEFGKYALWLDRAAIRLTPVEDVALDFGRFGNPFWTGDLLFDNDLNFDGVAVSARRAVNPEFAVFGTAGAFPIFNTDFNFGSRNAPEGKGGPFESKDKYLLAAQLGLDWAPRDDVRLRVAVGYFNFDGVEGEVSSLCQFYETVCDTDPTRPQFQQFGNTMFPIRNVAADPVNPTTSPENQYFGLASAYEVLNVRASLDFAAFDGVGFRIEGDYVENLGLDDARTRARAVNNLGPSSFIPDPNDANGVVEIHGPWDGGSSGWSVKLTAGQLDLASRGDWNVHAGYRHLESDAVLDAFTDSDFHLGGTNSQGWMVGGGYALGKNTAFSAVWLSAEEIAGAPLSVDRLLIDILTRF